MHDATAGRQNSDWYVAQIRPNQLDRARVNLERQGYPCLVPRQKTTRRQRQKLVPVLQPLFPGYVFLTIAPDRTWREVNATYGVSRLVMRAANTPQPVPPAVMAHLLERVDAAGVLRPPDRLQPGERVRITEGPMVDLLAQVERFGPAERVGLLLEMMGQAVRAELPRSHLQRLAG